MPFGYFHNTLSLKEGTTASSLQKSSGIILYDQPFEANIPLPMFNRKMASQNSLILKPFIQNKSYTIVRLCVSSIPSDSEKTNSPIEQFYTNRLYNFFGDFREYFVPFMGNMFFRSFLDKVLDSSGKSPCLNSHIWTMHLKAIIRSVYERLNSWVLLESGDRLFETYLGCSCRFCADKQKDLITILDDIHYFYKRIHSYPQQLIGVMVKKPLQTAVLSIPFDFVLYDAGKQKSWEVVANICLLSGIKDNYSFLIKTDYHDPSIEFAAFSSGIQYVCNLTHEPNLLKLLESRSRHFISHNELADIIFLIDIEDTIKDDLQKIIQNYLVTILKHGISVKVVFVGPSLMLKGPPVVHLLKRPLLYISKNYPDYLKSYISLYKNGGAPIYDVKDIDITCLLNNLKKDLQKVACRVEKSLYKKCYIKDNRLLVHLIQIDKKKDNTQQKIYLNREIIKADQIEIFSGFKKINELPQKEGCWYVITLPPNFDLIVLRATLRDDVIHHLSPVP